MRTRDWQKIFREEAPRYLENSFTKNTEFEVRFLIEELGLKAGDAVLDIGCGTGRHSLGLAAAGVDMTGIDLSPDMLEVGRQKAREQGLHINFIQGDASEVRLNKQFDHAILVCEGAFSLYEKGVEPVRYHRGILENVHAMLKPNGRFLMTILNAFKMIREHSDEDVSSGIFDPLNVATLTQWELEDGTTAEVFEKGFLPREITGMLEEAGFYVLGLWGGTAGAWNKAPLKLDEYEIMLLSSRGAD
jgi:cyclopropane fatty-acyl-phospholipid synthase-like methyltransferase